MAGNSSEYAVEYTDGKAHEHQGDVKSNNNGIHADGGSTVKQSGDVSANKQAVAAESNSKIEITGDVSSSDSGIEVYDNLGGNIDIIIGGNVTGGINGAEFKGVEWFPRTEELLAASLIR